MHARTQASYRYWQSHGQPRMASAVNRGRLHQTVQTALMQVIGDWVALHTHEEVLAAMAEARVPSGLCCHPSLGCLATHCGKGDNAYLAVITSWS